MKIGCCIGLNNICGSATASSLMAAGYDYLELPLTGLTNLSDSEADDLAAHIKKERLVVGACNLFFPGSIRLTGPNVDLETISAYVDKALQRAAQLDVPVLVVGSGGARKAPEGFPREKAWEQLVAVFRLMNKKLQPFSINIAVEPLNKRECNMINSLSDGSRLVREAGGDKVGLLADFYHMSMDNETVCLEEYRQMLIHTHFADPEKRNFPTGYKAIFAPFFDGLRQIHYNGGISMECGTTDLLTDAIAALAVVKKALAPSS